METKKHVAADAVRFLGYGQVKALKEGGVEIAGFANKFVVDRGKEVMATDSWELENYKKNPVILYNHGFDPQLGGTPIGKATEIKPTDDGLYIKAQISSLDDPLIKRIRGLVEERILRAFSVGFNPIESETDPKTGVKTITKAELFEVSIVGVPMNQDSLFELTGKMLATKSIDAIKKDVLKRKGAWVAAAVHNSIYEKQKNDKIKKEELLNQVAEKAGIEQSELMEVLAGNVTPVPEKVLAAFSEVLGLSLDDLKKLDAGDAEVEGAASETEQDESTEDTTEETTQGTEAQSEESADGTSGSSKENVGETNEASNQTDVKEPDAFQGCVADKIRKLMDEGKDQDQAVAVAISMCQDETKCQAAPTKKQYAEWFKLADSLVKKNVDDQPTTTINAAKTEAQNNDFGSPMLDGIKQTNVLLGAVVNELQKLSAKLDGIAVVNQSSGSDDQTTTDKTKSEKNDGSAPVDGMSDDELKAAQEKRSQQYGIEVLSDAALTFPADGPKSLEQFGDPVNLKFPIDSAEKAGSARTSFKQSADSYKEDKSKAEVHGRIVKAQLAFGGDVAFDEKDPLDAMLASDLKDKLRESSNKSLDSVRQRIENVKKRLAKIEG